MAKSFYGSALSFFTVAAALFSSFAQALGGFVSAVIAVAFPVPAPDLIGNTSVITPRVLGLTRTRSFRERLTARIGDQRNRHDFSVALAA